jgi:hypothetical protein
MLAAYIGLCEVTVRGYPELHMDDPNAPIELPERGPTLKIGPALPAAGGGADLEPDGRGALAGAVGVLGDAVPDLHPGHAAPAQGPLPRQGDGRRAIRQGFRICRRPGHRGAQHDRHRYRHGAAGIIVGTVTLTGIGLVMTELVELMSGGNLMMMLCWWR